MVRCARFPSLLVTLLSGRMLGNVVVAGAPSRNTAGLVSRWTRADAASFDCS